jgi:hypothetical protein
MSNRFLISVAAAALIAGTGFANAQGAGGMSREGGTGSTVQQSAPSAGGGAAQHRESAPASGMTSGQSEKAAPAGKRAEDLKGGKDMKAEGREGKEKSTVGQAPDKSGATTQREDKMGHGKMGRDDGKMGRDDKMGADKTGQKGSTDTNRAQTNQSGSQTTTGNAATSATVAPPAEKQNQIKTAFRSETTIKETTNVNFNINVGAVVPASVHFYPVPARIVEIYPEWRGYDVILVNGRYVIVRPRTHEIVYIIEG